MARVPKISRDRLVSVIRSRGPVSATELGALFGVNRTTIVRRLTDFGGELAILGETRSTRYLLRQQIDGIGNCWPLFRIDGEGRASEWGRLEAFHDGLWRICWRDDPPEWARFFTEENGLWSGFPFFLGDVRPQGFLGRVIAGRISKVLRLPEDPRRWSDQNIMVFLQAAGESLPGNVVVGQDCLRRALAEAVEIVQSHAIREQDRDAEYPIRAMEIARDLPGSSAGGEQPKFLVTIVSEEEHQQVLVKFSAPLEQETGRRWADLLACEFHAHQVLAEAGLSVAGARLLDAGGRRFLEVPRFDRKGKSGRLGVVTLEALSAASVGLERDWIATVEALADLGLVDSQVLERVRLLQSFGELIGNTDMHAGNLAFFLDDHLPLQVTPCYDMLPMLWAPGPQGEIVERSFVPAPPLPEMTGPWRVAASMAENFWERVTADDRISPDFRRKSALALEVVRHLRRHVG